MIYIALALEYLHLGHSIPITYYDLKPSNILLDENMVIYLSDFGISVYYANKNPCCDKLYSTRFTLKQLFFLFQINILYNSHIKMLWIIYLIMKLFWFIEYGIERQVSARSDVYNYATILVEKFTRKKPTDEIFAA